MVIVAVVRTRRRGHGQRSAEGGARGDGVVGAIREEIARADPLAGRATDGRAAGSASIGEDDRAALADKDSAPAPSPPPPPLPRTGPTAVAQLTGSDAKSARGSNFPGTATANEAADCRIPEGAALPPQYPSASCD